MQKANIQLHNHCRIQGSVYCSVLCAPGDINFSRAKKKLTICPSRKRNIGFEQGCGVVQGKAPSQILMVSLSLIVAEAYLLMLLVCMERPCCGTRQPSHRMKMHIAVQVLCVLERTRCSGCMCKHFENEFQPRIAGGG